jgi:1-acyl-sn-glycerol-3-phosphate acyltransferase
MHTALGRRLRTIPAIVVVWALVMVTLPALIPIALAVDAIRFAVRRVPFMATRLICFLLAYLTIEVVGLAALGLAWLVARNDEERLSELTFAVQRRWAEAVFDSVRNVFDLTFEATGLEAVNQAPMLILARHASIIDNLLPSHYISRPRGFHIGYVMKSELLVDPCLDVAGNRLPNVFVRRGSGEAERDIAAIRSLAARLGTDGGILIYPEGTRFTREKLRVAARRLEKSNPRVAEIAAGYTAVLPPRPSGTLALLEGCDADVVVMAHRGLDGFARVADIWRGAMVHTHVDVGFWRVSRSTIPEGRTDRTEWLFRLWADIDAWIAERANTPRTSPA